MSSNVFGPRVAITLLILMAMVAIVFVFFTKGNNPDAVLSAGAIAAIALSAPGLAKRNLRPIAGVAVMMAILLCVYVLGLIANPAMLGDALKTIGFLVLVLGCYFVGVSASDPRLYRWTEMLALGVAAGLVVLAFSVSYRTLQLPKNIVGGLAMHLVLLAAGARAARTGKLPLGLIGGGILIAGVAAGHRLVEALAIVLPFALWAAQRDRTRTLGAWAIVGAALVAFLSVMFMMDYRTMGGFTELNSLMQQLTGRQITSGRELIWGAIVRAILANPWFGHGPAAVANSYTGSLLSAHSAFLHIALQTGIIGILATAGVLVAIALVGIRGSTPAMAALLPIYVAVVVVHNSFETALYQNSFALCSMIWLTFGFLSGVVSGPAVARARSLPRPAVALAAHRP